MAKTLTEGSMSETKAKKAPSTLELKRIARMVELLKTERVWWDQGMCVAGMDEVGRGPLAGPVVTACVMIPPDAVIPGADDSKKAERKAQGTACAAADRKRVVCRAGQRIT